MLTFPHTFTDLTDAVAFTARATSNENYEDGDTVSFNGIITNFGGHYSTIFDRFTCPLNGTYMFSVNFVTGIGREMRVFIVKEGLDLIQGRAGDAGAANMGTALVITTCFAQERVWVRSVDSGYMLGGYTNQFSGVLLNKGV